MITRILAALALALFPIVATADETWITPRGTVVYENEIDGMAVFSLPLERATAWIYIPGLAGNFDNRDTHEGFWISDEIGPCSATLESPDGLRSTSWGRVVISFDEPAFPTNWSMWLGACFGHPGIPLRGIVP